MKITETRKAIIELIEPYMDKTLSEGCLVELWEGEIIDIIRVQKIATLEPIYFFMYSDFTNSKSYLKETEFPSLKTIGHYDITAVLKYIDNSYRDERGIPWGDTLLELTPNDIHINIGEELYMLPNKPLHLYTEEEDKQLLDLLIKLK